MKLTQKNFNNLVMNFNHKTTEMQNDIKWIKKIIIYMAGIISVGVGKIIIG